MSDWKTRAAPVDADWRTRSASMAPSAGPDSAMPPDDTIALPKGKPAAAPAPEPSFGQPGWKMPGSDLEDRLTRSMTFGISDYVGAAGDVLGDKIARALGYDKKEPLTYGEALGAIRMANRKFSTEHPVQAVAADTVGMLASPLTAGLSGVAGKVASALGTEAGSAATAAAPAVRQSLANMAVQGGIEGTAMGAGLSDALTPQDVAKDAAKGGALGFATAPLMGFIGRMINPRVNPDAQYLLDAGVTPKPGQILGGAAKTAEEKMSSLPIIGEAQAAAQRKAVNEFNVAGYNEALSDIGQTFDGQAGHEGLDKVRKAISDVYDSAKSKINVDIPTMRSDPLFTQDLADAAALSTELPPDKQRQFAAIIKNRVNPRLSGATMTGADFKAIQTSLGDKIDSLRSSLRDPDSHDLADALDGVMDAIQGAVARHSPEAQQELNSANAAWAKFARLRRAASAVGAEKGVFTPAQLYTAVRALDRSAGKGAFATGTALMQPLASAGKSVLGNAYPNSGTAGRLFSGGLLSGILRGTGEVAALPGLVAGSLPYLPGGRQVAAALVGQRPDIAVPIARAVTRAGLPLTAAGTSALLANE